jgi:hypothetical protein
MNYIEYKAGKVYAPAHLRQAKSVEELLALARQGHPLAWTHNGGEINLIIEVRPKSYVFSCWDDLLSMWVMRPRGEKKLMKYLRLAPLAVKDGRPLHVGDVIEENYSQPLGEEPSCEIPIWTSPKPAYVGLQYEWRWPVEVKE